MEKKELDTKEDFQDEEEESADYVDVFDDQGNKLKKRIVFSVQDDQEHVGFLYIEGDNPEELACLTIPIDENGQPLNNELTLVDENSKYLDLATKYLDLYSQGKLMTKEDAEKEKDEDK